MSKRVESGHWPPKPRSDGHHGARESGTTFRSSALPLRLHAGEIADQEEDVHQPEYEPRGGDGKKLDRDEDQGRSQEQHHAPEQPQAIGSTSILTPLRLVDPPVER